MNRKSLLRLVFEQCSIDKINHILSINCIFCNLEGGMGVLPRKILKNKKQEKPSLFLFLKTILASVNEQFQRILLLFIVCSFLNIKFRQIPYAYCLY